MIKNYFITVLGLLIAWQLSGQTQFENPGFEEWEPIEHGSVPEPVEWSSIRTAIPDDLAKVAPAIWGQSEDARTGNYSLYLINKAAFELVATGMLTNGRVLADLDYDKTNSHTVPEDPRWHTSLPQRPDSVVGWYKGKPKPGDFPTAKVLLHTGYASLPQADSSTWIGVAYAALSGTEVNEWTRFSAPFEYFNDETPQFMLTILTAGNGTEAIAGSEAWFDDLELIYNNGTSVGELTASKLDVSVSGKTLTILIDGQAGKTATLFVTDLAGRSLLTTSLNTGEANTFTLDADQGIYLVSVKIGSTVISKKVWLN